MVDSSSLVVVSVVHWCVWSVCGNTPTTPCVIHSFYVYLVSVVRWCVWCVWKPIDSPMCTDIEWTYTMRALEIFPLG